MALIADDAADRAQQMLSLTERLTHVIESETQRIEARQSLPDGEAADEKSRLVNAYRLEMARIKDDRTLIADAPDALRTQLRAATQQMQAALQDHERALEAVKTLTEGLVQAMAEEIVRIKTNAGAYGADGSLTGASGPAPVALNRTA